ncbi:MAG: hypothetical protein IRZ28_21985 [Steroidobacteraceae bacterium]|nr:hypothetical protein [Steroidobacteraceae bacterium]
MNVQRRKPDAIVRLTLRATHEGGRKSAIPRIVYRCPVFFGDQRKDANDCAFYLDEVEGTAEPGGPSVIVPAKFFAPERVADKVRPGIKFALWEGRDVGEGEVLQVLREE